MTIQSPAELAGLLKIGRLVGLTLQEMKNSLRAGMTTAELDEVAERFLRRHGARSAPQVTYNYPGVTCISINEEAAHGIPGARIIQPGDLVGMDVSAELDGFFADANITVAVPPVLPLHRRLIDCTIAAFRKGAAAAVTGAPMNGVGRAVEREVKKHGFSVLQELPGHGIGRGLHEEPSVPNFYVPRYDRKLTTGLVITIEPHISVKHTHLIQEADGWTLTTANRSLSASYEHTIVVMPDRAVWVTAVQ
ncbi:MAG: type I methionyl aminopeptidase [Anaerolineae bacterium]|nr:type I methionyl aminopeptidase [Anaerolineae bacterium]